MVEWYWKFVLELNDPPSQPPHPGALVYKKNWFDNFMKDCGDDIAVNGIEAACAKRLRKTESSDEWNIPKSFLQD